jgi:hypothetical protein
MKANRHTRMLPLAQVKLYEPKLHLKITTENRKANENKCLYLVKSGLMVVFVVG